MKKSRIAVIVVLVLLTIGVVFFFVPLVGVEAVPPNWQAYTTSVTVNGTQTKTWTMVRDPPSVDSAASLAFCFMGHGDLLQDGTYYPYTPSHLQVQGSFCGGSIVSAPSLLLAAHYSRFPSL